MNNVYVRVVPTKAGFLGQVVENNGSDALRREPGTETILFESNPKETSEEANAAASLARTEAGLRLFSQVGVS